MKIEIWSDVICPFCYIGKRQFEKALEQFELKDQVEIEWKSFQLSPEMATDTSKNVYQFLAEHKGIPLNQSIQLHQNVVAMAQKAGLEYDFDKAVVANSFRAHQFAHFAKSKGLQNEAEEALFAAYFTQGKNIDDIEVLMQLATQIGLDAEALKTSLGNNEYQSAVLTDVMAAQQIGVTGVPFFVFNRKYAVSGAQDSKVFLQALQKIMMED